MVRDHIEEYYLGRGIGCAESMLRAAEKEFCLGMDERSFKAMGAFAGGIGCEHICGAVTGGAAAIGALLSGDDAESAKTAKEAAAQYLGRMESFFGSVMCSDMKKKWRSEDEGIRCIEIMRKGAQILDEILSPFFAESMARPDYCAIMSDGFIVE